MKTFYVFEDYGYDTQRLVFSSPHKRDAIAYAETEYRRLADDLRCVEVASFATDGEYLTHWSKSNED